jgi:hypothetical protein
MVENINLRKLFDTATTAMTPLHDVRAFNRARKNPRLAARVLLADGARRQSQ